MKTSILTVATFLVSALFAFASSEPEFPISFTYDTRSAQEPFEVNVPLPDGNYLVTVKIGSSRRAGDTFLRTETRRLYVNNLHTDKGEHKTVSFVVNKRDSYIRDAATGEILSEVKLKQREIGKYNWDEYLNIEVGGNAPAVESVSIEPAPEGVITIFLCGDSTVVDQDNEPWASWGQMFPWFFDTGVAIANYAESGERADTFIGAGRLKKILSLLKEGDYVFVEFGHNDQKIDSQPGKGAYYFFASQLKTFIDLVGEKGGNVVLVSPTHRRNFDENGRIRETHLDYPAAMKWVAQKEGVPFIDLHAMSAVFYESLGEENSKKAFVHYKAGAFPGMDRDVADNTHFNPYGAFELSKCVVSAVQVAGLPIASHIVNFDGFSPACPDPVENFYWYPAPFHDLSPQVLEKDDKPSDVGR